MQGLRSARGNSGTAYPYAPRLEQLHLLVWWREQVGTRNS